MYSPVSPHLILDSPALAPQICKMDVETGETWVWRGTEHQYIAEPTFVPAPDAIDEDDGVLLLSVADVRKGAPDFLLVVDAKTMEEICRATIDAPLPCSIHGVFLPDRY
ncbi:Retinoid isomerohydrolase [Portunus trituberculatus]|uniref:Retinoid isomerohydrolase n=1 Tax=Portunus trituberculatus TaxID=210409 RepID=A0A5B7F691_PORTR|nr:Retinoid isomerohydrolase [Portunus trituberculatus]